MKRAKRDVMRELRELNLLADTGQIMDKKSKAALYDICFRPDLISCTSGMRCVHAN